MTTTTNVWIVEEDAACRLSLQTELGRTEWLHCDHIFPSCSEFIDAIENETHPDLVLMNLGLPGTAGLEAIRKLALDRPDISVLILSCFSDLKKALQSLAVGATRLPPGTSTNSRAYSSAKQPISFRCMAFSPIVTQVVLQKLHQSTPAEDFGLTLREIEVLEQLSLGLTVREIANELQISPRTAATHLEHIYPKLEVRSQSGAVAKALRAGII
ncbi:LuxR C-terminal-related transcriptional regulator [Luteolibacter algae]|uniref:LuxR C-terminal-related transcriptional regulator n=1 Tax=Luteolibacter algae TaxID=454151 RepID=A0ABW5D8A3_9BACT